jgi:hypothetical protein
MKRRVGYASPPEHSRWGKGHSGNPRGRPKRKADVQDDLMAELAEVIQITEGGKTKRITKQRALIKALTAHGLKGDTRAANILIAMCAKAIAAQTGAAAPDLTANDRKIVDDYLERQVELRLAQRKGGA